MKVSIIIPVYNVGILLNECLYSITQQTIGIEFLQVICVNDRSPQEEQELKIQQYWYERFPQNFSILKNSQTLGQGASRNRGLKFAKGEYIHFVDADDKVEANLYLDAYQQLKKSGAGVFRINYYRDPNAKQAHYVGCAHSERIMTPADKTRALFYAYPWMNIIQADLMKYMKPFREGIYEDIESVPTIFKARVKFYQTNKPYYYYRLNHHSITEIAKKDKSLRDDLKMSYFYNLIADFVDKKYFSMNYGMLVAQYFLIYMISYTGDSLSTFKSNMNLLKTWHQEGSQSKITLHSDTVRDFGYKVTLVNHILLLFWKIGFYEVLFVCKKIILLWRKLQEK